MKTHIRRAACAAACSLLALPAAAAAHGRTAIRPTAIQRVSGHPHAAGSASRRGIPELARRLHLSVGHAASTTSHFNYPLGLATNAAGDVFVANYGSSEINEITPTYAVPKTFKITQGLSGPISLATDAAGDIYAGNVNGGVQEYSASGSPIGQVTANAGDPSSIAADQFGDLYIAGAGALAIDDPSGSSLYSSVQTARSTTLVALGGAYVWSIQDGGASFGNGSVALRDGSLQFLEPSLPFTDPVGAACSASDTCWITDGSKSVTAVAYDPVTDVFSSSGPISLPYVPAGIAYDAVHQRLYIADPVGEAVHVYNAKTLALIRTIT